MARAGWKFWIDRGGTFTDLVACSPGGNIHSLKLPSDAPGQYRDAAAECIRRTLATKGSLTDPIAEVRMGTTVATNALLERKGPKTALVINKGFGDLLKIGTQQRPEIFALAIRRIAPLYSHVAELAGRLDATGAELEALDEAEVEQQLRTLAETGVTAVAICLLHAWRNADHEQNVGRIAQRIGFSQISLSHEVSPLIKIVERGVTTVTDAYLSPVLHAYVEQFRAALDEYGLAPRQLLFMQSNGGLVSPDFFTGKDALLSGPAGGVIGMAGSAAKAGRDQVIGFDMGGTSTDVSLYAGAAEIAHSMEVAGLELVKPTLRVHTIAAGGGSILRYENDRLQAGPESAGAMPGPMCYGHGGPLTVTDANVMLGRIQPEYFPAVFGPDGNATLAREPVADAFAELATTIQSAQDQDYSAEQVAAGFIRIAIENMANAIRQVSTQRGLNPADFLLSCFGGAAGQHACELADTLGIEQVLIDPFAGVLSAWGIGHAPLKAYRQASVNQPLNETTLLKLDQQRDELERQCRAELVAQDQPQSLLRTASWLELCRIGSDTLLTVRWHDDADLRSEFEREHRQRFGFEVGSDAIQIASLRVEVNSAPEQPDMEAAQQELTTVCGSPPIVATTEVFFNGAWQSVPIIDRGTLISGHKVSGPALITEANSTTWLDANWDLHVNGADQLLMIRMRKPQAVGLKSAAGPDPVMLEIYNRQFMHIATLMGTVLEKTALSVNIKERLDFSCAIFDPDGNLLANAPHIPVHLGSMDDTIRNLLTEERDALLRGDSFAANAPYKGGTHLPDVTVVSPLVDARGELRFIVASRAHHADIGGSTPGSMPPASQHIDEEGVVFDNVRLISDGRFCEADILAVLTGGPWPARNPAQNIADLKAQLAANERGLDLLRKLLNARGSNEVDAYCGFLLDNAEEAVRSAISRLHDGAFEYPLDNGQIIRLAVEIDQGRREASIDFSGTSPPADNNFNAPASVCQAALMYVFRTLVDVDIPLNAGCRRPLHLRLPARCMLNPRYPAAVVGGNVETSQCITDALFGALGAMAASQGTMNNLSFGDENLQYYETICGGAGAGPGFDGASAVQTHMTNSRITDPEVLELRFPVLLREFSIRKNSGGQGRFNGGDGVVRALEFRATMHAALLSNHRLVAPFGLDGGNPGQTGRNRVLRANGDVDDFDGIVATTVHAGDTLVIETPGGGGYGPPDAT
jgi:5-oxoprolinase (ATP-hydrolysing)